MREVGYSLRVYLTHRVALCSIAPLNECRISGSAERPNWNPMSEMVGWDRGADRASNDADVSSIPPIIAHRRGGSLLLRPRGPRSGPGCSVPVRHHLIGLIRPTRGHTAISPHGGLYAMPSLCGSAEATRERFRAFTAHSFLTCRHLRPREVRHRYPETSMPTLAFAE